MPNTPRFAAAVPAPFMVRLGPCATLVLALLAAGAAPAAGPGRIAVGGAFPHGYVGLLARHGLPREVLSDDQVGDAAALAPYDLVVIAGIAGPPASALPGLRKYVEGGGRLLLDYGPPPGVPLGPGRRFGDTQAADTSAVTARSSSPMRLVGEHNPLDPASLRGIEPPGLFREAYAPAPLAGAKSLVLAEFTASSPLTRGGGFGRDRRPGDRRDEGPAAPAILLQELGRGKLILCGQGIGMDTVYGAIGYDRLVLSLLSLLSDGRVKPQIVAEDPQLHFGESAGKQREAQGLTEPAAAPAVEAEPAWPNGPGRAATAPPGYTVLEQAAAHRFNLTGVSGGRVSALLGYWDPRHTVKVELNGRRCVVTRDGRPVADAPLPLAEGQPFTLKFRGAHLQVYAGGKLADVPSVPLYAGRVAVSGVQGEAVYQPVESVWFTDDFMRTSENDGGWTTASGQWSTVEASNVDKAANPFSYKVDAKGGPALALHGDSFWDEYRLTAATRPDGTGAVGLASYVGDGNNLVLFTAKTTEHGTPASDGYELVRVSGGQRHVLAAQPGGLASGQWYALGVTASGGRFTATVDGVPVVSAVDATLPGGRIGLYADGLAARFDDVVVMDADAPAPTGTTLTGVVPKGAGTIDVASWAGVATEWLPVPDQDALFWRRGRYFGDLSYSLDTTDLPDGAAVTLAAGADGRQLETGGVVRLTRRGASADVVLSHAGRELGRVTVPLTEGAVLGLHRTGDRYSVRLGERELLSAAGGPTGGRLAFGAQGYTPRLSALTVWTANQVDETFERAPVNWWVQSGTWELTNRWSCSPEWSWFGGTSPGVAAVWYKRELAGDQALDYYVGPMMGDGGMDSEFVGDFNLLLCGNGRSLYTGYCIAVGPAEGGVRLYRNGQLVAHNDRFVLFGASGFDYLDNMRGHNRWFNVRAEKQGAAVTVSVEGQPVLTYVDPAPLSRGYAAIWTRANGLMVPRASLSYERSGAGTLPRPAGAAG